MFKCKFVSSKLLRNKRKKKRNNELRKQRRNSNLQNPFRKCQSKHVLDLLRQNLFRRDKDQLLG
jgi:hypothetical protein